MARAASPSVRRPWIATAIRGWRQEIALSVATFGVLFVAWLIAPWGPCLVLAAAGIVAWQRPDLRTRFQSNAQARQATLRLQAAFWVCMVVGRTGAIPTIARVEVTSVGRTYLVRLPAGLHFEVMEAVAPELAAALGVRQLKVRSTPENASYVTITEILVDPRPANLRSGLTTAQRVDLWNPIPFGIADDGHVVQLGLPEHNVLIGGEPGSGKSVALSQIIAAAALDLSVSITLFDGKQVELAMWSGVAERFIGPDQDAAVHALEELRTEMDARYSSLLEVRQRKITRETGGGLHVIVIDELAFYLRGGKKDLRDQFAELLRDLVSRGRAAGFIVVAATQKPSHEVVPTWIRDLFAFRLAMRCSSSDASDTILGQGWAKQGFSAAAIDPSKRGVGYLLAEGGVPVLLKTPYLSDEEIEVIASRAQKLRVR